jgi:hypothetical protein
VGSWNFLPTTPGCCWASHATGVRLRDVAVSLDVTERSALAIVADLTAARYVVKRALLGVSDRDHRCLT